MGFNVLVGVPGNCPPQFEQKFAACLIQTVQSGADGNVDVGFAHTTEEFFSTLKQKLASYALVVAIEGDGQEEEYTKVLEGLIKRCPSLKMLVIVPDNERGSSYIEALLQKGFYNVLFMSDVNAGAITEILRNPRNYEAAMSYYGIRIRTTSGPLSPRSSNNTSIESSGIGEVRQLSPTLRVRRVSAGHEKKKSMGELGGDEVLQDFMAQDVFDISNENREYMV